MANIEPAPTAEPAPVSEPPEDSLPREDVEFRKDGGMNVWIEGHKFRLRNPRLREYRRFRDTWDDHVEELQEQQRQIIEWQEEMNLARAARWKAANPDGPDGFDEPTDDEFAEDRKRAKAAREGREDAQTEWWVDVMATLKVDTKPAPDPDEFPSWVIDARLINRAFQHWQSVPSLSGSTR